MHHAKALDRIQSYCPCKRRRQLRLVLLDTAAPRLLVDAILHRPISHKFIDHRHADAVVAISHSLDGEVMQQEIYGAEVLIQPDAMLGLIRR